MIYIMFDDKYVFWNNTQFGVIWQTFSNAYI